MLQELGFTAHLRAVKPASYFAPWVPYGNGTIPLFVSKAVDLKGVIWNPSFGAI